MTVDGSGSFGELESWSVTQNATPIAPGDPAAGSGGVQFSGSAEDDSDFLTGDDYTLTHEAYGTVSGAITRADLGPIQASLSGDNLITRLSAVRTVPPAGIAFGAKIQDSAYTGPAGRLHEHLEVNPTNNRIYGVDRTNRTIGVFEADGTYLFSWGGPGTGDSQFGSLSQQGLRLAVDPVSGNVYVPDPINNRIQIFTRAGVFLQAINAAGAFSLSIKNGLLYAGTIRNAAGNAAEARVLRMTLSGVSQVNLLASDSSFISQVLYFMALSDNYILVLASNGWTRIPYTGSPEPVRAYNYGVDPNGSWLRSVRGYGSSFIVGWYSRYLDPSNIIRVREWNIGLVPDTHERWGTDLNATLRILGGPGEGGGLVGSSFSTLVDGSLPFLRGFGLGYERYSFLAPTPALSELMQRYLDSLGAGLSLDYQATNDPYIAAPGWSDSVWTKLNELCVAHGVEIGIDDGTIVVRDIGVGTLNTEDATPISRNVSAEGASRFVDVQYTNATAGVGTVYDAAKDGQGRTFEVNVRETKTEPIQTTNYPVALQQPQRVNTFPLQPGQYYLIGSDNLPVAPNQFEVYGGSVTVNVSTTVPGGIDLNLTGPLIPIPGVPGPYRLAISDGSNTYPAFSVVGTGVFANPQNVRMSTGADWSKVTSEVGGQALSNTFLATRAQAWDRGRWAAVRASGPNVSITFSLSYENSNGFGLTAGSTFEAHEAVWRVDSVSFGAAGFQVQASLYTTFGDVQPLWDGETIGDFASAWDAKKIKDFRVRPLANAVD